MPFGGMPDNWQPPGFGGDGTVANPALGTAVRMPDGSWQQFGPQYDNNGNPVSPKIFESDSLPGGYAAALPGSDAYNHYSNVMQRDNNQGVLKVGALVGGGAALGGLLNGAGAAAAPAASGGAPGFAVAANPGSTAWLTGAGGVGGLGGAGVPAAAGAAAGGSGVGLGLNNWLSLGSNLLGGLLGSSAANKATNAQNSANQNAINEIQRQFDITQQNQAPYLAAGVNALGKLQDPGSNFTTSPGYQFRLQQGQNNLGNSFAARGGAFSGNALKALDDYNQGQASNEYNNWWNQQAGLAGVGQATTNSNALLGQNASGNVANLTQQQGNNRASGILGSYGSMYGGLNDALQNWLYRQGNSGP